MKKILGLIFFIFHLPAVFCKDPASHPFYKHVDKALELYPEVNIHNALLNAAELGSIETVQQLLSLGANPNTTTDNGVTPLMFAAVTGNENIAEALLNNQINPANPNMQKHDYGDTALMIAAFYGHANIIELLLNNPGNQANPNIKKHDGTTALMAAAYNNHASAVEALLNNPTTNPNMQKHDGGTALMAAAFNDHLEAAERLLNHPTNPADPDVKASNGNTALDIAKANGNDAIARLLEEESMVHAPGDCVVM